MFNYLHRSSAKFQPLSVESIKRAAPSVFTTERAVTTSEKYQYISTEKVIQGLADEGFLPVFAAQSRSMRDEKKTYAKHMLRFRHVDTKPTVDGLFPELVLINSHDGLSSYRLMSGVYRLVCSNGLIAGDSFNEIRIRHQGDIMHEVIEGTYTVINESQKMIELSQVMKSIELKPEEKLSLATAAHAIRFDGSELGEIFHPSLFLRPRRYQEANKDDLFTHFNIVQENIMKGGVHGWLRDPRGRISRRTTRTIVGIDQSTTLNKQLWTLAEKMMHMRH